MEVSITYYCFCHKTLRNFNNRMDLYSANQGLFAILKSFKYRQGTENSGIFQSLFVSVNEMQFLFCFTGSI